MCETVVQEPMPSLPVERGRPGPGLLAHVLIAKYADHLPLYRQSGIYAREGVDLERSTLAGWVGRSAALPEPLVAAQRRHVMVSDVIHGDDTPAPVLAPGFGKTKTGRLWAHVRDGRPYSDNRPPAAAYFYSPDRKGESPRLHLKSFKGILHADGYAGFKAVFETGEITEAACWAHVRRKFFDVHAANGSSITREALDRIGALYGIEAGIRGKPPDERQRNRELQYLPRLQDLKAWLETTLPKLSGKSDLAAAMRYALNRWEALTRHIHDGRIEIDNAAAAIYSFIETAKLNGLDPETWLRDVLTRIADHPVNRVEDLLPWSWASGQHNARAA